jgi:flavin reductase (DIM6/NTAB) family NADH-FMN oxidoreductase RutF
MVYPDVLSAFWTPLCAVGSHGPKGPNAQICVSVFGASIVPDRPRLLVNLSKTNYTCELVRESGTLAVTLLSEAQLPLLERLGLQSGRDGDKLGELDVELTRAGNPVFPGGIGYVAGEVLDAFDLGDATAYLVAVRSRETWDGTAPMRWSEVRETIGGEFVSRWLTKSVREQESARKVMTWR